MRRVMFSLMMIGVLLLGNVASASASLIAHFEFEGNTLDSSGNELHGIARGIPIWGAPTFVYSTDRALHGVDFGQAIRLDWWGWNSVRVAHHPLLDITESLTVMMWANVSCSNGWWRRWWCMDLLEKPGAWKLGEIGDAGRVHFAIETPPYVVAGPNILTGKWHHLAGTFDATTGVQSLFVDGILHATATAAVTGPIPTTLSAVRIGPGFWGGLKTTTFIDEVRIYDRALTLAEIQAVSAIPEPATLLLLGAGLVGLLAKKGTKRQKNNRHSFF